MGGRDGEIFSECIGLNIARKSDIFMLFHLRSNNTYYGSIVSHSLFGNIMYTYPQKNKMPSEDQKQIERMQEQAKISLEKLKLPHPQSEHTGSGGGHAGRERWRTAGKCISVT